MPIVKVMLCDKYSKAQQFSEKDVIYIRKYGVRCNTFNMTHLTEEFELNTKKNQSFGKRNTKYRSNRSGHTKKQIKRKESLVLMRLRRQKNSRHEVMDFSFPFLPFYTISGGGG